ncbi:tripartite tricarboxylate transporter substrate binding protein [Ramlibacter pallidus]|uniref:Tripartite tricarboxylate transporter substrate binding protein n=1 Tax=Ramlibacter pallidus TaxID=2780087 RepID=A0ABR9S193_9BURK|nr:tripartite tricarboxylate transporter substrate binding protein [Ramlibacter pallidus]MBE7367280.1 tripartite tricarboxylate transporter substrate binding protein [Ramlibacter pallidus]
MQRHAFLRRLAGAACACVLLQALPAAAQAWPTRPIRIVVPFAAGGSADVYARFLAQRLPDILGQPVVVENRPGAGAVIGTDLVAKAPPDGYTLLLMSNTHTVNETLVANKPYHLTRDFVAVAPINSADLVFVAHPSVRAGNVREVLQLAKERPGRLNYASSGTGTPYHMAGELFKSLSGTYLVHIPYKGSSGARADLLGGQVDLMFDAVTTMVEQVKAGKVKAIATTGRQRSAVLPEVPTVHESGLPDYEATIWLGLLAPKGTPPAVVSRLNEAVSRITSQADVQQGWTRQGATAMVMNPQAFDRYLQEDIQKWARLIRSAQIKAE